MSLSSFLYLLLRRKSYEDWLQLLVFYPSIVHVMLLCSLGIVPIYTVLLINYILDISKEYSDLIMILTIYMNYVFPLAWMCCYVLFRGYGFLEKYLPFLSALSTLADSNSILPSGIGILPKGYTMDDVRNKARLTDNNSFFILFGGMFFYLSPMLLIVFYQKLMSFII